MMHKIIFIFLSSIIGLADNIANATDNVYSKMNISIGYELSKYTNGIKTLLEKAVGSSTSYKLNKINHSIAIGAGYNFYFKLNDYFHPFIGFEATAKITVGRQALKSGANITAGNESGDGNTGDSGETGLGTSYDPVAYFIKTTRPASMANAIILEQNGALEDRVMQWYFNDYGDKPYKLNGESHSYHGIVPDDTIGWAALRQDDGSWNIYTADYTLAFNSNGLITGSEPSEDTPNIDINVPTKTYTNEEINNAISEEEAAERNASNQNVHRLSKTITVQEYFVFNTKLGSKINFGKHISISPYATAGFNVVKARVDANTLTENLTKSTTNIGLTVGAGIETLFNDKFFIGVEYRKTFNKIKMPTGGKQCIQTNSVMAKIGYYFL